MQSIIPAGNVAFHPANHDLQNGNEKTWDRCLGRVLLLDQFSSQRKAPANSPREGTTALLKMLLEMGGRFRGIMGFRLKRHRTSWHPAGLSSQGIFGSPEPIIWANSNEFILPVIMSNA
jgi:hypothetical protein